MTSRWLAIAVIAAGCKSDPTPGGSDPPADPVASAPGAPADASGSPDYPTLRSLGTETIWSLEDPDRGPRAPTKFVLPPRSTFAWTEHLYCVDDVVAPICTKMFAEDIAQWRLGRSKTMVVAEEVRAGQIDTTYVYESGADGTPVRQLELDTYGAVVTARMFVAPGRYSAREPNGANALDGCGFMTFELDAKGHSSKQSCVQWLGGAMRDIHGVGATKYVRDAKGFTIETTRWGTDGFAVVDETGVHQTVLERDARDSRIVAEHYRDTKGPVQATSGCFGHRFTRDAHGSITHDTCLDATDHPATGTSGFSIELSRVDARGCTVGTRYLGTDETPAVTHEGVHGRTVEADRYCATIAETCVDTDDMPMACGPGQAARTVRTRDALGRVLTTKHYTSSGDPGEDTDYEAFEIRRRWDAVGNRVAVACYDTDGKPMECSGTGYHELRGTWDDAGREVERTFADIAKAPTTNLGVSVRRYRYDNYDHLHETRNYDGAGGVFEMEGFAIRRDLYDIAHRRVGILLFDRDDKPARYSACYAGVTCPSGRTWHAVRIVRRVDGTVAENRFFDDAKQLIGTFDCTRVKCFD